MSIRPNAAAHTHSGAAIPAVIVGSGYQNDNDDDTYVEGVQRQVGSFTVNSTPHYYWSFDPDPNLPDSSRVRARVTLLDDALPESLSLAEFGVTIARASDGLVLTSIGAWRSYTSATIGVPTWVTFRTSLDADEMNALRTGSWPGYGAVELGAGWLGTPGAPTGGDGAESRVRLHELAIGPAAPPPLRRYPRPGATGPTRHWPRTITRRSGTY